MRLDKLASVVWLATSTVAAQDLAPEVLMLSRVKSFLRYEFLHLPNYTCLETISRFQKPAKRGNAFQPLDTVRLEIAYSDRHEWFGSPGDRGMTVSNPALIASGAGLIANGIFATTLHNLFLADAANISPGGEDFIDGRKAVKFDYRFPAGSNVATVTLLGGSGPVNEEGSVWIDPKSFDLLRLDGHATEIPPRLPLAVMEYTVVYGRTRIGEFDALLAQHADLHMIQTTGVEDYDRMDFTHCRMFHSSSTLSFDPEPASPAGAPAEPARRGADPQQSEGSLPALLKVAIEVTSSISDKDAVGKLIEGRVVGDVRRKGKVILEDGSPVRGRIRRLQRFIGTGHFIVGLEFTEVQALGAPLRFYADLVSLEKRQDLQTAPRERVLVPNREADAAEVLVPNLPGVASFFMGGESFVLPPGLRTVWRTREVLSRSAESSPPKPDQQPTFPVP